MKFIVSQLIGALVISAVLANTGNASPPSLRSLPGTIANKIGSLTGKVLPSSHQRSIGEKITSPADNASPSSLRSLHLGGTIVDKVTSLREVGTATDGMFSILDGIVKGESIELGSRDFLAKYRNNFYVEILDSYELSTTDLAAANIIAVLDFFTQEINELELKIEKQTAQREEAGLVSSIKKIIYGRSFYAAGVNALLDLSVRERDRWVIETEQRLGKLQQEAANLQGGDVSDAHRKELEDTIATIQKAQAILSDFRLLRTDGGNILMLDTE